MFAFPLIFIDDRQVLVHSASLAASQPWQYSILYLVSVTLDHILSCFSCLANMAELF